MKKEVCYPTGTRVKTTVFHGKLYTSTTPSTMRLTSDGFTVQILITGATAIKEQTPSEAMQNTQG